MVAEPEAQAPEDDWQVQLVFAPGAGGETVARRRRVAYPFHVGRPLPLDGADAAFCNLYLQSCSGGLFQHDRLGQWFEACGGARAHVTTAAASVVHATPDGHAAQRLRLRAAAGAWLEYLPEPLILFAGATLESRVRIEADPLATVVVGEALLAHDPAGGGRAFDGFASETLIADAEGDPLAIDRFRVTGEDLTDTRPGVHGGRAGLGSLQVVHRADPQAALHALRATLPRDGSVYAGASLLPGGAGAWLRALSQDPAALRRTLLDAWAGVREALTGRRPAARRK